VWNPSMHCLINFINTYLDLKFISSESHNVTYFDLKDLLSLKIK
jgi:hypothetical protein